jgi:putative flippase GtrA
MPAPDARSELLAFGMVGTVGFFVNTAIVYLTRGLIGPYSAGVLAWLVAATATWWLNRIWTFRSAAVAGVIGQWLRFLLANLVGFALYFVIYAGLIAFSAFCARAPVFAIAAGAGVSMAVNFILSRELVFSMPRR